MFSTVHKFACALLIKKHRLPTYQLTIIATTTITTITTKIVIKLKSTKSKINVIVITPHHCHTRNLVFHRIVFNFNYN